MSFFSPTPKAIEALKSCGAEVEEVALGWTSTTLTAASNYLGHIFGNMIGQYLPKHREDMTNYARSFAEFGRRTTADDLLASMEVLNEMYATLWPLLEKYNVFVCPTMAVPAMRADYDPGIENCQINGKTVHPIWGWTMTYPFNMMSRCPVMSVPSGKASNGVPTGLQIVGRTFDDVSVFRAAKAFEETQSGYGDAGHRPGI